MTTFDDVSVPEDGFDLLPADPTRGLDPSDIDTFGPDGDGTYEFGMHSAAGAARVTALVEAVVRVLDHGLGREVAVATLLGGCLRLERDGHGEYSDTVVRESIWFALEPACERAGVAPFTDAEVGEAALQLSLRGLGAYRSGYVKGLDEAAKIAAAPR